MRNDELRVGDTRHRRRKEVMSSHRIEFEIEIDAPIEVVWRTISEPTLIPKWFSEEAVLEVRPGALGTLTFCPETSESPIVAELTVVDVDPPNLFSYRWDYPAGVPATPENSLLVTFTLVRRGESSTLFRVVETGLEHLDWSDDEKGNYATDHLKGWRAHADRLANLDFNELTSSK
jgi:uncharacterized protein YndB with AHSA1/START domain